MTNPSFHLRSRSADANALLAELRTVISDQFLAQMLGLTIYGLDSPRQSIPVRRLILLYHRLIFRPGDPITLIHLLTGGKYEERPQERPACGVSIVVFGDGEGI